MHQTERLPTPRRYRPSVKMASSKTSELGHGLRLSKLWKRRNLTESNLSHPGTELERPEHGRPVCLGLFALASSEFNSHWSPSAPRHLHFNRYSNFSTK